MKNENFLLMIAIGDALGLPCEYVPTDHSIINEVKKLESYHSHPTYHDLLPGMYTDDTQMSIAVMLCMLENGSLSSKDDFLSWFFRVFKFDPRKGYSKAFQEILESSNSVEELKLKIVPFSTSNGAAMRSIPLGFISDIDKLKRVAGIQASVTHDTWGGINSSISIALMSHFAIYTQKPFSDMHDWVSQHHPVHKIFDNNWSGRVNRGKLGIGMRTVWAVQTLLKNYNNYTDMFKTLIDWGGDTDSVAALSFGIASFRFECDLPQFVFDDLEKLNDTLHNKEFLKSLGCKFVNSKF